MMRAFRRGDSQSSAKGQAMVEFALVAPLFLILLVFVFEAGRYVMYLETLNNAAREGARYAIVHGSNSGCPSGPPPGGEINNCDPDGSNVTDRVAEAALAFADSGELVVHDPVWWFRNDSVPARGDSSTGTNERGNHVTVFVDYSYDPVIKQIFQSHLIPTLTVSAESSLVINN